MTFAKIFEHKRYNQIVLIKKQDDEGAPELRFFFQPEGYGVCSFAIGWERDLTDDEFDDVFRRMVPREAIEIVDGYMREMLVKQKGMN